MPRCGAASKGSAARRMPWTSGARSACPSPARFRCWKPRPSWRSPRRCGSAPMADVRALADRLFPAGHDVRLEGERVVGSGRTGLGPVAVVGTHGHAAIGVDLALALAADVLQVIERHPGRPVLVLVDTRGQKLSRRDELLGNPGYLAHLAKVFEVARQQGHPLLALVHGEAVSGGFLALGMIADAVYALPEAQVRVI